MEFRIAFWLARAALSLPLLLLQILFLPILLNKENRRRICFRLMASISVADCLALFSILTAPMTVIFDPLNSGFRPQNDSADCFRDLADNNLTALTERRPQIWMERLLLSFYINSWNYLLYPLEFLLALERLVIVLRAFAHKSIHGEEPKMEKIFFNALLLILWLIFGVFIFAFMTPQFGLLMDGCFVPFYFVSKGIFQWNRLATQMEHYSVMYAFLPLTCVSYFCIILLLILHRLKHAINANSPNNNFLAPREMRILTMATIQLGGLLIPKLYSNLSNWDVNGAYFNQLYMGYQMQIACILVNGMNPFVYFFLINDMRLSFLRMMGRVFEKIVGKKLLANISGTTLVITAVKPAANRTI